MMTAAAETKSRISTVLTSIPDTPEYTSFSPLPEQPGLYYTVAMAPLYIVGTPIGNLRDITLRALDTLKGADVVACEDTRHTGKLLRAHGLEKKVISCHSHNKEASIGRICSHLDAGRAVAYLTDAGTPAISDPGAELVSAVRERKHEIVPIPGPSAVTALMSAAGIGGKTIVFDGFLSPKGGRRRKRLAELLQLRENFILFESPHRIVNLLTDLADLAPERLIFIGREMTKLHEEFMYGTAADIIEKIGRKSRILGEFSLFVSGKKKN